MDYREQYINAIVCRLDLIEKYDSSLSDKNNIQEQKWCKYLLNKIESGWNPTEGDTTLEVQNTLKYGLCLRKQALENSHEKVDKIVISIAESADIVYVNFNK